MISIAIASASNREVKICKKMCKKMCKTMCKKIISTFRLTSVIFKRGTKIGVNSMEVSELMNSNKTGNPGKIAKKVFVSTVGMV